MCAFTLLVHVSVFVHVLKALHICVFVHVPAACECAARWVWDFSQAGDNFQPVGDLTLMPAAGPRERASANNSSQYMALILEGRSSEMRRPGCEKWTPTLDIITDITVKLWQFSHFDDFFFPHNNHFGRAARGFGEIMREFGVKHNSSSKL